MQKMVDYEVSGKMHAEQQQADIYLILFNVYNKAHKVIIILSI